MPVGSEQWGFNQVIKALTHFNSECAKWITTTEMDSYFILIHRIVPMFFISPMVLISEHPSASNTSLSSSVSIISSLSEYWKAWEVAFQTIKSKYSICSKIQCNETTGKINYCLCNLLLWMIGVQCVFLHFCVQFGCAYTDMSWSKMCRVKLNLFQIHKLTSETLKCDSSDKRYAACCEIEEVIIKSNCSSMMFYWKLWSA